MPVIGPDQQPPRTFPSRLQRYWEHPHPYGLIAMLKSTLDSIDDAVNGSIAATGAPPSTEEEAFRYNQARDRGAIGAFRAAADFSPAAPEFAGAALGRRAISGPVPQAIEGRFPQVGSPPSLTGAAPYSSARPETAARGWQPSTSGGSVPSVPPPAVGATPSGGLLARLRELDALERQQPGTNVGPASPAGDPNFRELRRVLIRPLDAAMTNVIEQQSSQPQPERQDESWPDPRSYSEWLAPRKRAQRSSNTAYRSNGRRQNDGSDDDFCTKRKFQEEDKCSQRWRDGEFAHKHHYWGCRERARLRWAACMNNEWEPSEWELDPEEELFFNTDR